MDDVRQDPGRLKRLSALVICVDSAELASFQVAGTNEEIDEAAVSPEDLARAFHAWRLAEHYGIAEIASPGH